MLNCLKKLSFSARISRICALLGFATLIGYCIYGAMYQYFDSIVFLTLALGVICAECYARFNSQVAELLNLLSAAGFSFGLGLFFLNSHPVWADRLNNIEMYGARGSLTPVILLMVLLFLCSLAEIVSCFTGKDVSK